MVGLNRPDLAGRGFPLLHGQQQIARCPIFRVTVWGVDPEDLDKAIPFQMHPRAAVADGALRNRTIALPVRIDQAIGLQARQSRPAEGTDVLEIGQTALQTSETDIRGGKPALLGGLEHRAEVVIFGQPIRRAIKEAIVAWDGVCIVTPHEGHQIDPRHNAAMFARPVPPYQGDLARIGFIQRRIVDNQETARPIHERFGFPPQQGRIGFEPMQQPIQGIMGRATWPIWLYPRPLCTRNHARFGHQKVDIVEIGHFRFVHGLMVPQVSSTA
jgi:hypothetical protein